MQRWTILIMCACLFLASCLQSTNPTESDLQFADVVDLKISSQNNQVTCLLYIQTYNECQEPRLTSIKQTGNSLDLGVTTFQANGKSCDSVQNAVKVWHTFTNVPDSSVFNIRIRATRDSRTNKPVDTLIVYARR